MASTPQNRSGSYRVEWRLDGRRDGRKQSVTFPELAKAQAAKELAEARHHRITDDEVYRAVLGLTDEKPQIITPRLVDWIDQWLAQKVNVATTTIHDYARTLRCSVVPRFGRLRLAEITREDIDQFRGELARTHKPAGVRKIHNVFRQVMAYAVPRYLDENPCDPPAGDRVRRLPKVKRYHACFLTPEEADMIVRAADPQIRDLIQTAFGTGLRLGELLGLRVCDLDLEAATPVLRVRQALKRDGTFGPPKTERSERSVTISRTLVATLGNRITGKRPHHLVFPAPWGGTWQHANLRHRFWRPAIIAASRCAEHPPTAMIPVGKSGRQKLDPEAVSDCACKTRLHQRPRVHDTRHSHVGWLIDAGWDLYAIQLRIGHESIKTTFDVYGHRLTHGDTAKLDALDAMLNIKKVDATATLAA